MKAYSMDLRERVVAACDAGDDTREEIAARFSVSVAWVRRLLQAAARDRLDRAQAPRRRPTARLRRRRRRAAPPGGPGRHRRHAGGAGARPPASPAAPRPCTGRWSGWGSREKKVAAGGRAGPARAEGRAGGLAPEFAAVDPARLVFVDETGATTAMDPPYGRARAACGSTARCRTATGRS